MERVYRELNQCPTWLVRLVHYMHYHQATVITLNYDTLLERAFSEIRTGQRPDGVNYVLDEMNLHPIEFSVSGMAPDRCPTAELLKLHGSINWWYSGRQSYFGEPIRLHRAGGWLRSPLKPEDPLGRSRLIVPPLADKLGYFDNEAIRYLWMRARATLRGAKRIFCVGYSLPQTDLTFRFLLQDSQPVDVIPFYFVNLPSAQQSLEASYATLEGNTGWRKDLTFLTQQPVTEMSESLCDEIGQGSPGLFSHQLEGPSNVKGVLMQMLPEGREFQSIWGVPFSAAATESGLLLSIEQERLPVVFPWNGLDYVLKMVREQHDGLIEIHGETFDEHVQQHPPTLDWYLKRYVNRPTAAPAVTLLQQAGLLTVDPGRRSARLTSAATTSAATNRIVVL